MKKPLLYLGMAMTAFLLLGVFALVRLSFADAQAYATCQTNCNRGGCSIICADPDRALCGTTNPCTCTCECIEEDTGYSWGFYHVCGGGSGGGDDGCDGPDCTPE